MLLQHSASETGSDMLPRASRYQGVAFFSMNDVPLGFGVAAASTKECRKLQSTAIIAFHQADVGQYVREEDALTAYTS